MFWKWPRVTCISWRLDRHVSQSQVGQKVTTTDAPSAPFFLEGVENFPSGAISAQGEGRREKFFVWTRVDRCLFKFHL